MQDILYVTSVEKSLSSYGEVLGIPDRLSSLRAEHHSALTVIVVLHIFNIKWNLRAIVSPVHIMISNKEVVSRMKNRLTTVSPK